jgi:hypothetical protein
VTDLEDQLLGALRACTPYPPVELDPVTLRAAPPTRHSSRLTVATVAAVAATVIVLAIIVSITAHHPPVRDHPALGGRSASVSARGCPQFEKCPPPQPPKNTIELTIGGRAYSLRDGAAVSITLHPGSAAHIAVAIASPTGAPVADVWLTVNSYPSGDDGGRPSGKARVLSHHSGPLAPGQKVTAIWSPVALFGTRRLDLTLYYSIGDAGVSTIIAKLSIR